ncbi:MAG: aldehyde dehydrogenase family protein [Eubacteriales bacterium]|nr:aldehyde dehydrogenase family protein [Eubacteriales bacterium]
MKFIDKDLSAIQEARILMEEAKEVTTRLALMEQEKLDRILNEMMEAVQPHLEELSRMAVLENGYGCPRDQVEKSRMLLDGLKWQLKDMRCVGILQPEDGTGTMEVGVPAGVIAAICPAVNPVASVLNLVLLAVKTGNAIILMPHPRSLRTTIYTAELLAKAATAAGLPKGTIACIQTPAREAVRELMESEVTKLVVANGLPKELKQMAGSTKPILCAGIAPSPVFIERTADVKQAAADIVLSRSFDCGTTSASEQYLVVDQVIAEEVKRELEAQGAWFMSEEEQRKLIGLLGIRSGSVDEECTGKSAVWLAAKAGFAVPENTRVLVSSQPYISDFNPYAKALLCPVIAFYIEEDWIHACEKCMNLLVEESCGTTLVIHSRDEEVIRQFVLKKPVGRVLINTPAALGAMGVTADLFPSVTLGSASAGQGTMAGNLHPRDLIYIRKAARGVRTYVPTPDRRHYQQTGSEKKTDAEKILKMIMEQLVEHT